MKNRTLLMKLSGLSAVVFMLSACGQGASTPVSSPVSYSQVSKDVSALESEASQLSVASADNPGDDPGGASDGMTDEEVLQHLKDRIEKQITKIEARIAKLEAEGKTLPEELKKRIDKAIAFLEDVLERVDSDAAFREKAIARERRIIDFMN